ncbi:receptor-like protein kinase, partial [Trifolium pratense]
MMGMLMHFLSVLLGVLTILVSIQAQDQSGFISLDCGLPVHSRYSDRNTGINYISDANFIDTGLPEFEIHLGANFVDTVNISFNETFYTSGEIIYTPSQDYIQPCLVNIGKGTPFISAIELRPLNNTTYVIDSANSVLSLFERFSLGSNTDFDYRYNDDVYDRIWSPYELSSDWRRLSTSVNNVNLSLIQEDDYKPPAIVMSTAVTPVNESAPLQFYWDADN